ncbi:hypothetical protein predicted by Glimmer/Critica [Salmonella enterica subsp. enterica serovar Weltevreden str. 2007-60-3289-1]|nr:hypothetical protein predicted by Glimmer/Critica [Salmonella enterica subsp. enterica serovar Weltevreden str. 2007-60-3289-1]
MTGPDEKILIGQPIFVISVFPLQVRRRGANVF